MYVIVIIIIIIRLRYFERNRRLADIGDFLSKALHGEHTTLSLAF